MRYKSIPVEQIGLDLKSVSPKDLEEIANFIEQHIRNELNRILNQRLLGYVITISVEIMNDAINIAIDLEADSYLSSHISLESILDKVLQYAFAEAKVYLSTRFRKTQEHSIEQ